MLLLRSCLLAFLICWLAIAQVDRASVTGSVRDSSGQLIPGATVTVTYPENGLTRSSETNDSGVFLLSGLTVGHVVVEVVRQGFRPVRSELDLNVGQTKVLDFAMDLATITSTVEVVAEADLSRNSATIGTVFNNEQISLLPLNGRNYAQLMNLTPGAVDTGAGNGASVRFFGQGGDDINYRIDGVDATSVRNQNVFKSRIQISEDAIAEFRVNANVYTAESGGSDSAQVEIASKSGSNQLHGSFYEYLRNSYFDARSPFDRASPPPFRLNQFGSTFGGALVKDKTFFFLSFEGLIQRQGITQIAQVPSDLFRSRAVPAVQPLLNLYPRAQTSTANANVGQWVGVGISSQDEFSGLGRIDHRFTDKLSGYVRFSRDKTDIFAPNAALPYGTRNLDAPTSGLFDFLYLANPQTTNELRLGANYAQPLNSIPTGAAAAISIPSLSTIPGGNRRLAVGITESLIDQFTTLRGAHTIKAGVEFRRVQLIVHDFNLSDGTASYATQGDFQINRLNTLAGSGELPTKQLRKIEYFGYAQDEWKARPNLTLNLGLRYEFYNAFTERFGRAIPFDVQTCGGYCTPGSDFLFAPKTNLAPRVSFAWLPEALSGKTVVRGGFGIYYGDAQLGDQYSPANNDAVRYTLSQSNTPGLSYPFEPYVPVVTGLATAPRSMPRNRKNQTSQQWTLGIQQALNEKMTLQVSYAGQENYHVFSRTYVNVLNPSTGRPQFPNLNQEIDVRGSDGVSNFHGLLSTLQINGWHGWLLRANYQWTHAIDDGSSGGGSSSGAPQNIACRSCERGPSDYDARHVFNTNFAYQLPFGRGKWWGGWSWSGVGTARSGLPINVTVSRAASDLPDGNALSAERPNLVPGVPLYVDYGTTGRWLNRAAFVTPARGTWGNLGRNALRAPRLFQIDTALSKETRIAESWSGIVGAEVFNLLNHPQLGVPASNITGSNFGQITTLVNPTPVGAGTPRQIQLFARLSF